jgi:hypothetical protein
MLIVTLVPGSPALPSMIDDEVDGLVRIAREVDA